MALTCEEYVINRVVALEEEKDDLTNNLEALKLAYDRLESELSDIKRIVEKRARVKKLQDGGSYYIDFPSIWKRSWDEAEFDDFHAFLKYFDITSEVEETEVEDGNKE